MPNINNITFCITARGGSIGCAGVCNGGGGASAMVLQRLVSNGAL